MEAKKRWHLYIAYLLGHAFVTYVERSQGRVWRRVLSNWRQLEPQALEAIKEARGFPHNRYYFCPPVLAEEADIRWYQLASTHRTLWKREIAQEPAKRQVYLGRGKRGFTVIWRPMLLTGRSNRFHHFMEEWPANFRELEPAAHAAYDALSADGKRLEFIPCPAELAALAEWEPAGQARKHQPGPDQEPSQEPTSN